MKRCLLILGLLSGSGLAMSSESNWGVVVDQTMTFAAQSFAKSFSDVRNQQYSSSRDNLTVTEKTSARWGSLISIVYKNTTLMSMALQNGKPVDVQRMGQIAVAVEKKIQMYKLGQALTTSRDLAKDEI